jgi:hypothetical protein
LQYQCVELVMRHFKTHWGLRWYGNAKNLLDNAPRTDVDVFTNGDAAHPPVPGDMVVWRTGTWGHVALVTAVRTGAVDVIEQNVSGNGAASLPWDGAHIGARWGSWVPAGWAHAKANTSAGTPPAPPPPPSTGVQWSCSDSSYQGRQYWTCDGADAFRCSNGAPEQKGCGAGCYGAGVGKDDLCIEQDPAWSCSSSSYHGGQFWTCGSDGALHKCSTGAPEQVACAGGCRVRALGTDDTCR